MVNSMRHRTVQGSVPRSQCGKMFNFMVVCTPKMDGGLKLHTGLLGKTPSAYRMYTHIMTA